MLKLSFLNIPSIILVAVVFAILCTYLTFFSSLILFFNLNKEHIVLLYNFLYAAI